MEEVSAASVFPMNQTGRNLEELYTHIAHKSMHALPLLHAGLREAALCAIR
jgi:hypothetical protein